MLLGPSHPVTRCLLKLMKVNFADITQTLATLMTPETVPRLKKFALCRGPMSVAHAYMWTEKVQLMNGYGPRECYVISVIIPHVQSDTHFMNIGRAVGGFT